MARRRLPCSKCPEGAWLKNAQGQAVIPYEIGVTPSAFRTPGEAFRYDCQRCRPKSGQIGRSSIHLAERQIISKQAFFALPDLDALPPTG